MKKGFTFIDIYMAFSLFGMLVFNDFHTYDFDFALRKIARYEHYFENYKRSLLTDVTPFVLRIKKSPHFNQNHQVFGHNGMPSSTNQSKNL